MILTLCKDNEEHIISIDPGDDFIHVLTTMFGNVSNYAFTVDGERFSSARDLGRKLHHNARIELSSATRSAPLSLAPKGLFCELKSHKNPSRPIIKIETIHISCSSDSYDAKEDMAGMLVYSFNDQQKFELNGHRCRTGYVLIKTTKNVSHVKSDQGIVHGSLFKWFYGMEPDNRFIGAGFAIRGGKYQFNSSTFNARDDDYHDENRAMAESEIYLIKYTLEQLFVTGKWQHNPTMLVKDIFKEPYYPGDHLPIQNHPKQNVAS